jgi:hypothetical protein
LSVRDGMRRCRVCGDYHWLSQWPHNHVEEEQARSSLPAPMVISDTIEPVKSMADGKYYSSKAALRSTYKPSGNPQGISYVEVGNETASIGSKSKRDSKKEINESLQKALARYERGERVTPTP